MDMSQVAANAGGIFSSIFLIASYTMTTMIPLRIFGILTNLVLITFSFTTGNYATMILHMALLPLNSYRLHQMLTLVRDVKKSVNSDLSMAWLKPFMTERQCQAGEVLFYKDEKAEEMFYIVSGRYRLVEMGMELPLGTPGRRDGYAVAEQQAYRHARMHRERPDSRRHLSPGRGAVCAEPRVRLLFLAACERAAVRESLSRGGAGRGADRCARRCRPPTSRLELLWPTNSFKPFRALANWLFGEDDHHIPPLPQGLPADFAQALDAHVRMLVEFQNTEYAVLYLDRLGRFHERRGVSIELFREIADLLAARMSFNDPIRVAQIVLGQAPLADPETSTIAPPNNLYRPEMQEFVAMFPRDQAEMIADALAAVKMLRGRMRIHIDRPEGRVRGCACSCVSGAFVRVRSAMRRKAPSTERWLHMIDRALTKQPDAVLEVVRSIRLVSGYGASYRLSLDNWNLIINRLAKPVFDGELALPQLPEALSRARSAAMADASGEELRRTIADIRATAEFDGCAGMTLSLSQAAVACIMMERLVISLIECKRGISE